MPNFPGESEGRQGEGLQREGQIFPASSFLGFGSPIPFLILPAVVHPVLNQSDMAIVDASFSHQNPASFPQPVRVAAIALHVWPT
jgi:hypothetical protein